MLRSVMVGVLLGAATVVTAAPVAAQPVVGTQVDLRVLVVTDGGPAVGAIARHLSDVGVPFDTVDLADPARPTIDPDLLADTLEVDGVPIERARYQAVVLPNAAPFADTAELTALHDYERQFGVRQVNSYVWPTPSVGLQAPGYAGPLDGTTATVSAAGLTGPFRYLDGPVPFEDNDVAIWESYGYLAQPVAPAPDTTFTPMVTGVSPGGVEGVLVGEYVADGREQLSLTFAYNSAQQQFRLLAPGIVDWATRGVHLGHQRNYLSIHVDDIFVADSRWSVAGNCTPGEDCTQGDQTADIRMTAADVAYAVAWQDAQDFTLDMVYNAVGAEEFADQAPGGVDPVTEALLQERDEFRWVNHTYTHQFLGCLQDVTVVPWRCRTDPDTGDIQFLGQGDIEQEINANLAFATQHDLPLDPTELVTGEHSGLRVLPQQPGHNPNLGPALDATGVRWIAADNSRMPQPETVGAAVTVPRHPLNLFFNVGTEQEQVDEYNWIYNSRADGGSGICEDNPAIVTCIAPLNLTTGFEDWIVPIETRLALARITANDPRPHYVHQSNMAEDRLLYPVLDEILAAYDDLFAQDTPLVCQRMSANGLALQRQQAWATAVGDGDVTAYVRDGVVSVTAPAGVQIPLTVPSGSRVGDSAGPLFGEAYAGSHSDWSAAEPGDALVVTLP